jgi:hypothetical protein
MHNIYIYTTGYTRRIGDLEYIACRLCHVDDPSHQHVTCPAPCPREHTPCGHVCPKLCGQACGECRELVPSVPLPCGHEARNEPCYL